MYRWVGNDAAMNLHEYDDDGWARKGTVAFVRPQGDGFRVVVRGTDKQVPVFITYKTQKEAMEAAIGFVKLLKEN
jgi:hypothetical protein